MASWNLQVVVNTDHELCKVVCNAIRGQNSWKEFGARRHFPSSGLNGHLVCLILLYLPGVHFSSPLCMSDPWCRNPCMTQVYQAAGMKLVLPRHLRDTESACMFGWRNIFQMTPYVKDQSPSAKSISSSYHPPPHSHLYHTQQPPCRCLAKFPTF
jgi:hypothetical protein